MTNSSYAETILLHLKGKTIEVYSGDSNRTHIYLDYEINNSQVIKGTLKDAVGECLMIECAQANGAKSLVYINSWAVTAIVESAVGISFSEILIDSKAEKPKKTGI